MLQLGTSMTTDCMYLARRDDCCAESSCQDVAVNVAMECHGINSVGRQPSVKVLRRIAQFILWSSCIVLAEKFAAWDRADDMQEDSADVCNIVLMPVCYACMYEPNRSQKPRWVCTSALPVCIPCTAWQAWPEADGIGH